MPEAWVDPDNDPRGTVNLWSPWLEAHFSGARAAVPVSFIGISPHCGAGRHRLSADAYRGDMTDRFTTLTVLEIVLGGFCVWRQYSPVSRRAGAY